MPLGDVLAYSCGIMVYISATVKNNKIFSRQNKTQGGII